MAKKDIPDSEKDGPFPHEPMPLSAIWSTLRFRVALKLQKLMSKLRARFS